MSGGVGKGIQDDEAILAAMNDAAVLVIFTSLPGAITEDAARGLLPTSDVGIAPRRPDVIHGRDSLTFHADFGALVERGAACENTGRQQREECRKTAAGW